MFKRFGLCLHNLWTTSHSIVNTIGRTYVFRAGLHHEGWPFPWSDLMVQLPWYIFVKKSNWNAFGLLGRCKQNVDQEEWLCIKSECVVFLMPKKGMLKKNQFKFVDFSCLHLVFPEKYIPLKNYDNIISLPWPLVFFYYNTSFTSPTAKLIGPCQWIM